MAERPAGLRVALLSLHSSPLAEIGERDAGGMNVYVRRLAHELAGRGMAVDVFTRRADGNSPEVLETEIGARFINLRAGAPRRLPKAILPLHVNALVDALLEFAARDGVEYDLLHAHYWLSGLVALHCGREFDAPVISMFHTLSRVKQLYAGAADGNDSTLRVDGERRVITGSDVVVGATEEEGSLMAGLYGVAPRQFTVIPPGVDLTHFRPRSRDASRRALGLPDVPTILFVGRFDSMKGLDRLLAALAWSRDTLPVGARAIIVGGDGADGRSFRALARRLGVDRLVDFRGLVSPDALPEYFAAADVCAVPSVYESFGLAAVEAMACGTPVVAFRVGGLAETVRHGLSGTLVEPGDIPAFGEAMVDLLTSPRRHEMGCQARAAVQRYSWERTIGRVTDLYQEIAGTPRCHCGLRVGA